MESKEEEKRGTKRSRFESVGQLPTVRSGDLNAEFVETMHALFEDLRDEYVAVANRLTRYINCHENDVSLDGDALTFWYENGDYLATVYVRLKKPLYTVEFEDGEGPVVTEILDDPMEAASSIIAHLSLEEEDD